MVALRGWRGRRPRQAQPSADAMRSLADRARRLRAGFLGRGPTALFRDDLRSGGLRVHSRRVAAGPPVPGAPRACMKRLTIRSSTNGMSLRKTSPPGPARVSAPSVPLRPVRRINAFQSRSAAPGSCGSPDATVPASGAGNSVSHDGGQPAVFATAARAHDRPRRSGGRPATSRIDSEWSRSIPAEAPLRNIPRRRRLLLIRMSRGPSNWKGKILGSGRSSAWS